MGKQSRVNVNNFICEFRQRLIDCFLQQCHHGMVSRDRLAFYTSFKQSHLLADYLCIIKKAVARRTLIRFRLGVSLLKVRLLRYTDRSQGKYRYACPRNRNSFPLCMSQILNAQVNGSLERFYLRPSACKMAVLLEDTRQTLPLAICISKAFRGFLRLSILCGSLIK